MSAVAEIRPSQSGGYLLSFGGRSHWFFHEGQAVAFAREYCVDCEILIYDARGGIKERVATVKIGEAEVRAKHAEQRQKIASPVDDALSDVPFLDGASPDGADEPELSVVSECRDPQTPEQIIERMRDLLEQSKYYMKKMDRLNQELDGLRDRLEQMSPERLAEREDSTPQEDSRGNGHEGSGAA